MLKTIGLCLAGAFIGLFLLFAVNNFTLPQTQEKLHLVYAQQQQPSAIYSYAHYVQTVHLPGYMQCALDSVDYCLPVKGQQHITYTQSQAWTGYVEWHACYASSDALACATLDQ